MIWSFRQSLTFGSISKWNHWYERKPLTKSNWLNCVLLGQYRTAMFGTWWYWVSILAVSVRNWWKMASIEGRGYLTDGQTLKYRATRLLRNWSRAPLTQLSIKNLMLAVRAGYAEADSKPKGHWPQFSLEENQREQWTQGAACGVWWRVENSHKIKLQLDLDREMTTALLTNKVAKVDRSCHLLPSWQCRPQGSGPRLQRAFPRTFPLSLSLDRTNFISEFGCQAICWGSTDHWLGQVWSAD